MSCDDCQCGIPEDAVVLNVLHIVECVDSDGEIWKVDLSHGGDLLEMASGKYFELAQWANMMAQAPILGDMIASQLFGEDEDGTDEISEVTV